MPQADDGASHAVPPAGEAPADEARASATRDAFVRISSAGSTGCWLSAASCVPQEAARLAAMWTCNAFST